MNQNLKLFLACLFLFSGIGNIPLLMAQQVRTLSLEELIQLGIAHSNQLKADSTQLSITDSRLIQAKNYLTPQVNLNLSYKRISDNITPFSVDFPNGKVELNPQILNQSFNNIAVRQPVYLGGRVKYGLETLDYEKQAVVFDIAQTRSDVSYKMTTLWYNLFVAKASSKIIAANIQSLENQKRDADNFVNQGILLANDVLKIDLTITNLNTSLVEISSTINLLKYNIALLTGLGTNTLIDIPETLPLFEKQDLALAAYVDSAIENRAEVKSLDVRQKQAASLIKFSKSNYLPILSAGGNLFYDLPNQRLFPNQAKFTGTWDLGLYFNWNLSELFTNREKVKESRLNLVKINSVKSEAIEGIQMEVNADYTNYQQALKKIELANKAVQQATENFRVEQNRFSANTTTPTDFLVANNQLLQARINVTTAIANAELAYLKLQRSTHE